MALCEDYHPFLLFAVLHFVLDISHMHAHLRVDPPPILEKGGQRFAHWLPKMCKKPHPKVWGPNYGNTTRPDKCKSDCSVEVFQLMRTAGRRFLTFM